MPHFTWSPLTPASWPDFATLFGANGACGGCWCMLWRLPRKAFDAGKGAANCAAMRQLAETGPAPGILGYLDGQVAAWCSLGPRADFPGLERSRILQPVDERPVWSLSCLFIEKKFRRQGLSSQMIRAAADFARQQGANILEAYPVEPKQGQMPAVFAWTGIAAPFLKAGFLEVARRSETRPILRLEL